MPATIVTRSDKGSPLTWNELDANFTNINNELLTFETGTFAPTISGATTAGVGTYSVQSARYTKIGNLVTFTIQITYTAHTGTGILNVNGFPYSPVVTSVFPIRFDSFIAGAGKQLVAYMNGATNFIRLAVCDLAGASVNVVLVETDSAGTIIISGSYITA